MCVYIYIYIEPWASLTLVLWSQWFLCSPKLLFAASLLRCGLKRDHVEDGGASNPEVITIARRAVSEQKPGSSVAQTAGCVTHRPLSSSLFWFIFRILSKVILGRVVGFIMSKTSVQCTWSDADRLKGVARTESRLRSPHLERETVFQELVSRSSGRVNVGL